MKCVRNAAEKKFLNFHIGEASGASWRNPLREFALFAKSRSGLGPVV